MRCPHSHSYGRRVTDPGWAEEAVRRLHRTSDELTACTSSVRVIASDHYLFAGERPAFQLYLGTQSQTVSAWQPNKETLLGRHALPEQRVEDLIMVPLGSHEASRRGAHIPRASSLSA